jgi:hypothetical protein
MAAITATAPHGYRACGTTDEITDCDHCGKSGLKSTVILRFLDAEGSDDGERYVGVTCAGKMLSCGKANPKLATRILREAQAADRKRADAVEFSREHLAYYEPFLAQGQGAYIREYTRLNKTGMRPDFAQAALDSLARHREVIATGGASALDFA